MVCGMYHLGPCHCGHSCEALDEVELATKVEGYLLVFSFSPPSAEFIKEYNIILYIIWGAICEINSDTS